MDVHTKEQRHYNMSQIHSKNTQPELEVRNFLWHNGFRYRLHSAKLPGKPDIILKKYNTVIFINGCFWHMHKCRYFKMPLTNTAFWLKKLNSNIQRDKNNYKEIKKQGWKYIIIWECQLKGRKKKP
jgi:DNA mismatch endonuclease (patch repair protein)